MDKYAMYITMMSIGPTTTCVRNLVPGDAKLRTAQSGNMCQEHQVLGCLLHFRIKPRLEKSNGHPPSPSSHPARHSKCTWFLVFCFLAPSLPSALPHR